MNGTALNHAACRLRRVAAGDLEILRSWRNSPRVRAMMYSDAEISASAQRAWFQGLAGDPTRAYFLFEVGGRPVGSVYYNPINFVAGTCAWGFYRGAEDAPAGSGMAMGYLGLEQAFDGFGLSRVEGETFSFNERGLRFHRELGFSDAGEKTVERAGLKERVMLFTFDRVAWIAGRDALALRVFRENRS